MLVPAFDAPALVGSGIAGNREEAWVTLNSDCRTNRVPGLAIRREARRVVTNVTPDLSIARARLSSICVAATDELDRYSHLANGWDGYNGEPISPLAIELASGIVAFLAQNELAQQRLTDIIPGPARDGSLDLELRGKTRRLIITIYPCDLPDHVEIRTFRTDGVVSEEKGDIAVDALVADLRWLLA
jgi:hypothetical protein